MELEPQVHKEILVVHLEKNVLDPETAPGRGVCVCLCAYLCMYVCAYMCMYMCVLELPCTRCFPLGQGQGLPHIAVLAHRVLKPLGFMPALPAYSHTTSALLRDLPQRLLESVCCLF